MTRFEIRKVQRSGKPSVEIVVLDVNDTIRPVILGLGYTLVDDLANTYSIICATPEALNAARQPLAKYFDRQGQWIANAAEVRS